MTSAGSLGVRRASRLAIASPKQVCAGLLFVAIGGFTLVVGLDYPFGKAARIGPGYFPVCLSLLLIALGLASVVRGLRVRDEPIGGWPLTSLGLVTAGVVAFAVLIDFTGLVESGLALLLISCLQRLRRRPLEVAVLCAGLLAFVVVLFVKLLQMPFRVF